MALGVVFIVEIYEYRKYVSTGRSLLALGAGMQESFTQVVNNLNSLHEGLIELKQDTALAEQEMVIVRNLLEAHSESLQFKNTQKLFDLIDKLRGAEE